MNVLKNFEALFVVTLGLACAANYVIDIEQEAATPPATHMAHAAAPAYAAANNMQVIVVSAKRMTAEQKMQSQLNERKASASAPATSRI